MGSSPEHPMVSVLLLEEFAVVRQGLRHVLEAETEFEVLAGVATLSEAVVGLFEPDVVVHGLDVPDARGPELVARLRARFPKAGLLALTRLDHPTYVHLALSSGDNGYVLKTATTEQLLEAIRRVAAGEEYVQPSLGAVLARWDGIPRRHEHGSWLSLTRREHEVIELVALGHTNAEVARALGIALRTVEAHRAHAASKLGVQSRAELVRFVAEYQRFDSEQ